jgi:6-phosphofructokinase 1
MVIVVAEGAGQDLIAKSMKFVDTQDASGNKLLLDVGLWLSQNIKVRFLVQRFISFSMWGQTIL